jgi:type II secretory pathway component PulJ
MISMTILGLVVVIIVQSLWLGHRSWQKGEKVVLDELHMRTVIDLISKQLHSTYPLVTKEEGEEILRFSGDSEEITFVTSLPVGYQQKEGLFYISYILKDEPLEGRKVLVVDQRPVYGKDSFSVDRNEQHITLLSDLVDGSWAYSEGGEWLDAWDEETKKTTPEMVKLTLHYQSGKDVVMRESVLPLFAELKKEENKKRIVKDNDEKNS